MLQGALSSLSVDLLADVFFDTACNTGALAVLGNLTITELDVRIFPFEVYEHVSVII